MKNTLTALVGTGILLTSSAALAQQQGGYGWQGSYSGGPPPVSASSDNIGEEAQIVFGVDRVMGIAYDRNKLAEDPERTTKSTTIALFGSGSGGSSLMPRLALDYFVVEQFSVGGSFVYWHQSSSVDVGGSSGDGPSTDDIVIHPRVGFAYAFDETFGIWPRAGITWFSHKTTQQVTSGGSTNDVENKTTGFNITGEVPIVISPFEQFAILIGPYIEIPLSGTNSATGQDDADSKTLSLGLTTSIVGYY